MRFIHAIAMLLLAFPACAQEHGGAVPDGQIMQSGTGIAAPVFVEPDAREPFRFPDSPLEKMPTGAVSVQFLVEHRTALHDQKVTVHGVIVSTLLGDKACPPDRGMCAQPRIMLADTADAARDTAYDLVMLLPEGGDDAYEVGQIIDISGTVSASPASVIMRKE